MDHNNDAGASGSNDNGAAIELPVVTVTHHNQQQAEMATPTTNNSMDHNLPSPTSVDPLTGNNNSGNNNLSIITSPSAAENADADADAAETNAANNNNDDQQQQETPNSPSDNNSQVNVEVATSPTIDDYQVEKKSVFAKVREELQGVVKSFLFGGLDGIIAVFVSVGTIYSSNVTMFAIVIIGTSANLFFFSLFFKTITNYLNRYFKTVFWRPFHGHWWFYQH